MAIVTISQGKLEGGKSKTDSGFEYYEFLEIPYAKPPVGDLRFKSPQEPGSWENIRDATSCSANHVPMQIDLTSGTTAGDEDCLYLNVFTPKLPADDNKLRPVIFYIHGGGFIAGNGILKDFNGPDFLLEHDVVVVTINYRLGVFGFLSLDTPEAAGNMGLKDQVKALEWVQKNIETFGGNKNNVTILGVSAGSASCDYLILSPLAKGLFHKAILMSGSSLNDWAINFEPMKLATQLAEKLGYKGSLEDMKGLHDFLMTIPAKTLAGAATNNIFQVAQDCTSPRVLFGFVPTVEKDFGNGQGFLTDNPYKLLKENKFNQVPVIRGFLNREGSLASIMNPYAIKQLAEKKYFVDSWAYKFEQSDAEKYNSKLSSIYLNKINSDDELEIAVEFYGDLNFVMGIWIAGKLQAQHGVPTYMYQFCYDGKLNFFKAMFGVMRPGAAHGDDIGYFLRHQELEKRPHDEVDVQVRSRVTKMWTDFAKTGNPTPGTGAIQWPRFEDGYQAYLKIDKNFTIETNLVKEKIEVFEEIYAKYEK